jgi:hypothetical protein
MRSWEYLMRINEITDQNNIWKNLIDLDLEFDAEFKRTDLFVTTVLRVRHRNKYQQAKDYIKTFTDRANEFLSAKPFDPADPDIISLQHQVRNMIEHLSKLEQQLK